MREQIEALKDDPNVSPQFTQFRTARWQRLAVERDRPSSIVSRPLMIHRSSVVLPDPERPMTATTSPDSTSSDTSSSTG
jgi:hypothetical protein